MALTENEKQILGIMTDKGLLRGEQREAVSDSDDMAREVIAKYKEQRMAILDNEIAGLTQYIVALNTEKAALESVQ